MDRSDSSTWQQSAWFACGCTTVAITLIKSLILTAEKSPESPLPWLCLAVAAVLGYLAADVFTGVYHWAIDNYGSAETPVFGTQIVGFLNHHRRPSVIADEPIARNLYVIAASVTVVLLPITAVCGHAVAMAFLGAMSVFGLFSQQFHAWSHTPPTRLPRAVAMLQHAGILLPRAEHAGHHRPPFDGHYCIVSGIWNRLLDNSKFFLALEVLIFAASGVRPRSWTEPVSVGAPAKEAVD